MGAVLVGGVLVAEFVVPPPDPILIAARVGGHEDVIPQLKKYYSSQGAVGLFGCQTVALVPSREPKIGPWQALKDWVASAMGNPPEYTFHWSKPVWWDPAQGAPSKSVDQYLDWNTVEEDQVLELTGMNLSSRGLAEEWGRFVASVSLRRDGKKVVSRDVSVNTHELRSALFLDDCLESRFDETGGNGVRVCNSDNVGFTLHFYFPWRKDVDEVGFWKLPSFAVPAALMNSEIVPEPPFSVSRSGNTFKVTVNGYLQPSPKMRFTICGGDPHHFVIDRDAQSVEPLEDHHFKSPHWAAELSCADSCP